MFSTEDDTDATASTADTVRQMLAAIQAYRAIA